MSSVSPLTDAAIAVRPRCDWAKNPLAIAYHDTEWGVPVWDDTRLFEFLVLESAQAGLSWDTILQKREGYRAAFAQFNPHRVATFTEQDIESLLQNPGIIRNRRKIEAAISNAQVFLALQEEYGSFAQYMWGFQDGLPQVNHWTHREEVPAVTPLSETISKDLKKRGFRFFGPTICYAHMQATGMVNDHLVTCFRHHEVQQPPQ